MRSKLVCNSSRNKCVCLFSQIEKFLVSEGYAKDTGKKGIILRTVNFQHRLRAIQMKFINTQIDYHDTAILKQHANCTDKDLGLTEMKVVDFMVLGVVLEKK